MAKPRAKAPIKPDTITRMIRASGTAEEKKGLAAYKVDARKLVNAFDTVERTKKAKELRSQRSAYKEETDRSAIREKLGYNKPVADRLTAKIAGLSTDKGVKGNDREYAESYGAKYNPNTGSYDYPSPEAKNAFQAGMKDLKAERASQADKDIRASQDRTAKLTKLGGGDYEKGLKMSKGGKPAEPINTAGGLTTRQDLSRGRGGEPAVPGESSAKWGARMGRNIARERGSAGDYSVGSTHTKAQIESGGGGGGGKGKGRGNWGHKGRKGQRGGSA
jgi:hypothetical protein